MANKFGPWATLIDAGGNPQLSAFWRRRLVMLVPASRTSPVLSRRNLSFLVAAGILACVLPTVFFTTAAAQEKKPAENLILRGSNDSTTEIFPAEFINIPVFSYNDLSREENRKELKISSEQEKKLRDICGNYFKQLSIIQGNIQKEFENLTPEDNSKKNSELELKHREDIKNVRKQIDELLTPEQLATLKSTAVGNHFGRLLSDQRTAKNIGVSEEQLKQLTQLREGVAEKEEFERLSKIIKQNEQKMLTVLTPQQWEKIKQNLDKSEADNAGLVFISTNQVPVELIEVYDPDVRKELAINAEQQTKLDAILVQSESQTQELIKLADNSNKNLPAKEQAANPDELQQKLQNLNAQNRKQIEEALTPRQLAELKKFALQRKFIHSLYMLRWGLGSNTQPGILDRIGASEKQKAELRRLTEENNRLSRKNLRETGEKAMKILSPQQQEYLLDDLDQLIDSDAAEPPADAAKSSDEKQSLSKSGAGMVIVGNSSADAPAKPYTPAEGTPAIGNENVRSLATPALTKVEVDGLEQSLGTGKGIMTKEQAIRELEKAGADVQFRPNGKDVFEISLREKKVGDEVLSWIGRISETRDIDLARTNVSDAGLNALSPLRNLEILVLTETGITDAGVKQICEHKSLWHLNLGGTKVTDDAIPELAKMPRLTELMITGNSRITDRALERLIPLKSLKTLFLNGTRVTDDGLRHLKEMPNLQTIGLYKTGITDKGVQHLAEIQSLRDINLNDTQISNVALDRLAPLPNLEHLEVSSNRGVSKGAVEAFRKAHPRCKVEAYGQMGQ
jgi:Spy/CpxP family protein refolding chaperone